MSDIPSSQSTVCVSFINANIVEGLPPSSFLMPTIRGGTFHKTPCFVSLIEHTRGNVTTRMLFDLGIRKDLNSSTPSVIESISRMGIDVSSTEDMTQILAKRGLTPSDINAIIFSHLHLDHIGDLSIFPSQTRLIVGSRKPLLPGYPTDASAPVFEADVQGRTIEEIDFSSGSQHIRGLRAVDVFKDGSFYLLETTGHTTGHISALARTIAGVGANEDSFLLLGGDVCHHAGALRPSILQPLSEDIIYKTLGKTSQSAALIKEIQRRQTWTTPFYKPAPGGFNQNVEQMLLDLQSIERFDADPRVFVILSHDFWLLEIIDLFPENANNWREEGWADKARWQFLRDFDFS